MYLPANPPLRPEFAPATRSIGRRCLSLGARTSAFVQSVRSGARLRDYDSSRIATTHRDADGSTVSLGRRTINSQYCRPYSHRDRDRSCVYAAKPNDLGLSAIHPHSRSALIDVWTGSASALSNGWIAVLSGVWATGILMFMSRFPTDRARGPLVMLDRAALPAGIAIAALGLYVDIDMLVSALPPPRWALFANQYLIEAALIVVALGSLTAAYALTKGGERQRVIPVLFTFAFYVATSMAGYIYRSLYTNVHAVALAPLSVSEVREHSRERRTRAPSSWRLR